MELHLCAFFMMTQLPRVRQRERCAGPACCARSPVVESAMASTPRELQARIAHDALTDRRRGARNWSPSKMLYCSKTEQDHMASETHSDQRQAQEHQLRKGPDTPVTRPQAAPPALIHGLESLRSSDC
jgi:hypothetical protein